MAIKVKLLQKKISKERKSLYLDFYSAIPNPKTGKETRREFLGLYIHEKPRNAFEKQHNAEQLKLGEAIRQKRENELNKPEIYNEYEKERLRKKELGEMDFVEYYRKIANKRKGSNHDNWMSALTYLENFINGKINFTDVNERFIEECKEILLEFYTENNIAENFERDNKYIEQAFNEMTDIWFSNLDQIKEVKYLMIAKAPLWGQAKSYIYNPETKFT